VILVRVVSVSPKLHAALSSRIKSEYDSFTFAMAVRSGRVTIKDIDGIKRTVRGNRANSLTSF
jgi:hypothetical protein